MSQENRYEVIDPLETIISYLAEEMDSSFTSTEETIKTVLSNVFSSDPFFIDAYARIMDNKDKVRMLVKKFNRYVLPKIVLILSISGNAQNPIIERMKEMYMIETVYCALYRSFIEVLNDVY